jgi:hypothetical protein
MSDNNAPYADSIYGKLFAIQAEMPTIPKNATNPHFKSKYADLPTIMEILQPILTKHKVLLLQPICESSNENFIVIDTRFVDIDSGQICETTTTIPIGTNKTPQAFGSAITYARRYALCSFLGIVADEDDDGNASSAAPTNKIGQAQVVELYDLARKQGYSKEDVLAKLKPKGIHRADQLTPELHSKFMTFLENNPKPTING